MRCWRNWWVRFPACPAISGLNLAENRNVTNDGIAYLAQLHWLTELNLSSCAMTNEGLTHLKGLSRLSRLDLSYCNRITDLGVKVLRGLRNLTYLSLRLRQGDQRRRLQAAPRRADHLQIQIKQTKLSLTFYPAEGKINAQAGVAKW